jgi:hypothetical protein
MSNVIPEYQITHVHPPGQDHAGITHYWVPSLNRWVPTAEAVQMLGRTQCRFFVLSRAGNKAYASVVDPAAAGKTPYLRTHADGKWDDNLKSLPGGSAAA